MELTLVTDHRFYRDSAGTIFSPALYGYTFMARRYLSFYDRLNILARVAETPRDRSQHEKTEGDGVVVTSVGDWRGAASFLRHRQRVRALARRHILEQQAVVLVAPSSLAGVAARELKHSKKPFGMHVIGDPFDVFAPGVVDHPLRPLVRWYSTRQLQQQCVDASAVLYITERKLQKRYPPSRTAFSMGCSDVDLSENAIVASPRYPNRGGSPISLIAVGSMAQLYKGHDILLEALAIAQRQGLDLSLALVGEGRFRPELERKAETEAVSDRVRFLGQLPAGEAVRAALDESDLFVMPSRTEGSPRVLSEAMARGLPCIGSAVGGIPELLAAEDLVPPGDAAALARKIAEVAAAPERMASMSVRNLARAREFREDMLQERRSVFYHEVRTRTEEWLAGQPPARSTLRPMGA